MNKWLKYMIIIISLLLCMVVGLVVIIKNKEKQQNDKFFEVAQTLGNDQQAQIAYTRRCWDIFTHCGLFLYFETESSLDEFQALVGELGFSQERFSDIDGYTIFTGINLGTERRLTVNGNDGLVNRFALPEPKAKEWHIVDRQGEKWVIAFYAIKEASVQYAIDGQDLNGNIVSLLLQTR